VSINGMRACHCSLKASLGRFNIVPTAKRECGDGLQTEEHIFWDCKLYEDMLSENSKKKRKPKVSYRALKAKGKKICARRLLLHTQNS
jgi:hypothetical protein